MKFCSKWIGTISDFLAANENLRNEFETISEAISGALWELEKCGATPVCFDGKVGGNAAALLGPNKLLVVSKSGKLGGRRMHPLHDVCIISHFDMDDWSAEFYAESSDVLPTSDTPLHYAALRNAPLQFDWSAIPTAAVHGHAIETIEAAQKLKLPISEEETLFSTKEDSDALVNLMGEYSFPKHSVFIRKGHGFVVVGEDVEKAMETFDKQVKPFI